MKSKVKRKVRKRPETSPKSFKPCSADQKFFTGTFSQFCTRNFKTQFANLFFSQRESAGTVTLTKPKRIPKSGFRIEFHQCYWFIAGQSLSGINCWFQNCSRASRSWVRCGRSDTAANPNANSDALWEFASEFGPHNFKQPNCEWSVRKNSLANANGFANEMAEHSFSLANANGFANEMTEHSFSLRTFLAFATFATNFASDSECDGLVHSVPKSWRAQVTKSLPIAKSGDGIFFVTASCQRLAGCPSTVSCLVPTGESPNFRWIPSWEPNQQSNRLKALLRGISLSEYGSEGFRVRLRRLSEYGSVAYLVERPLGGRFGYFLFFSVPGRGGGRRRPRRWPGAGLFIKKYREGGGFRGGGAGGGRAPGRMSVGREGGSKYFFSGPKCPPRPTRETQAKQYSDTVLMKIGFFFFFARIDSHESPRFALRIAGPSKARTSNADVSGGKRWGMEWWWMESSGPEICFSGPEMFNQIPCFAG